MIIALCFVGVAVAISLCVVRFAVGPTLPDRVVAFDVIVSSIMAGLIIFGISEHSNFLFDVLLVICFLSFLGTTAAAYYLEKTKDLRGINEVQK